MTPPEMTAFSCGPGDFVRRARRRLPGSQPRLATAAPDGEPLSAGRCTFDRVDYSLASVER